MISYYLIDPTGNITLLVDSPCGAGQRVKIARELMKAEPSAEQVGFIGGNRLDMAGGEFCGNATLSAASVYCLKNGIDEAKLEMSVSGAENPVSVDIVKKSEGVYGGRVEMPSPEKIENIIIPFSSGEITATIVKFKGISHIIIEGSADRAECERIIPLLCKKSGADCLGMMFIEGGRLTPLVYAPIPGTLVWESSCASGTTAAGIYLASKNSGFFKGEFDEPGGKLGIEVSPGNAPVLTGSAVIKSHREIPLDCGE